MSESATIIPRIVDARSRLGVAARRRDPEAIAEARRDLAAANIAAHIRKIVDDAPPLSAEQRAELAALLGGAR